MHVGTVGWSPDWGKLFYFLIGAETTGNCSCLRGELPGCSTGRGSCAWPPPRLASSPAGSWELPRESRRTWPQQGDQAWSRSQDRAGTSGMLQLGDPQWSTEHPPQMPPWGSLASVWPGAARGSFASCFMDICSSLLPAPGRHWSMWRASLSAQSPQIILDLRQGMEGEIRQPAALGPSLSPAAWFAPVFSLGHSALASFPCNGEIHQPCTVFKFPDGMLILSAGWEVAG